MTFYARHVKKRFLFWAAVLAPSLWPFGALIVASVAFGIWQGSWAAGLFLAATFEVLGSMLNIKVKRIGDVMLGTMGRKG